MTQETTKGGISKLTRRIKLETLIQPSSRSQAFNQLALSAGASFDSPDLAFERNHAEDVSKVRWNGERGHKFHESNGVVEQSSSPVRRDVVSRSLSAIKALENDEIDLEGGRLEKGRDRIVRGSRAVKFPNQALLSGCAYCISSCSMILVNKFVLSGYNFDAGISLMVYQNFISVVTVTILSFLGVISTEPLTWRLIKVWLPVNVIFVGMLITSMFSLKYINVAMVTVLKNVTNVITAVGEMYLFNKRHDNRVWAALFLMIISAISGGITDLSFHAVGYAWQIINCFLTASYSLTLRRVMDTAKQVTKSGNLNEFSMVLLNNSLSLPLGVLLVIVFNEVDYLSRTPLLRLPSFWLVMTLSGFLGLAISFTSMWFLHQTGATTYSYSGRGNKVFKDDTLLGGEKWDSIVWTFPCLHDNGQLIFDAVNDPSGTNGQDKSFRKLSQLSRIQSFKNHCNCISRTRFTRSPSPLSLHFSSHSSSSFVSVFPLAPAAASSPSPLSLATTPDLLGGRCSVVLLAGPRLPRLSPSHSLRLLK
ncbi:GDP-mannose transporter GONST1 [Citrus sinensis]|nr:GDP-mannose transporter GONST1 [Citrus sinensis]